MFVSAVRNRDMSWPEEMSSLANNRSLREKLNLGMSVEVATAPYHKGKHCYSDKCAGLFCMILEGKFFLMVMFFTLHILYIYLIVTYLHSIKVILKVFSSRAGAKELK